MPLVNLKVTVYYDSDHHQDSDSQCQWKPWPCFIVHWRLDSQLRLASCRARIITGGSTASATDGSQQLNFIDVWLRHRRCILVLSRSQWLLFNQNPTAESELPRIKGPAQCPGPFQQGCPGPARAVHSAQSLSLTQWLSRPGLAIGTFLDVHTYFIPKTVTKISQFFTKIFPVLAHTSWDVSKMANISPFFLYQFFSSFGYTFYPRFRYTFYPRFRYPFIPASNTLFIPVSDTLFIPVSNALFIPVFDTRFIPVSDTLF